MDDLISRKSLLQNIVKKLGIKNEDYFTAQESVVISCIYSEPSAQQWIPVTEKLPEANEIDEKGFIKAYLVQDARWMDVARWNGDVWIAWGYGTVLKDVTAWMPLPEPWKGEVECIYRDMTAERRE